MNLIIISVEIIILLACAAFFSGTETAVTAITRPEYRSLKKVPAGMLNGWLGWWR